MTYARALGREFPTTLTPERPVLHGKTILITRQLEQSAEFVAAVERRGGRALVVPMIRITDPDSWDDCDRALDRLPSFDAIVFSSSNAVDKFVGRCETREIPMETLRSVDIYAVGRKTEDTVKRKGLTVRFVPEDYSGKSLARHFTAREFRGKRVLLPKGDRGRDNVRSALTDLGAVTDSVVVYKNVPPDLKICDELWNRIAGGEIDVITFASPSAIDNFSKVIPFKKLSAPTKNALVAVIGPTTSDALTRHGRRADIVSKEATVEGLVDAIAEHFDQ